MATELEGHPDNAAAALLGGLTVSCQREDGRVIARPRAGRRPSGSSSRRPSWACTQRTPGRCCRTRCRSQDAIFNLQRALLLVHALRTGRYDDLREAMRDRWHQPARRRSCPGLAEALALDHPAVLGVCLSGAGPSIVALATDGAAKAASLLGEMYRRLGLPCTIRTLSAHQPFDSPAACVHGSLRAGRFS